MSRPILVGLALRDDDDAPLALAKTFALLSGAPLALTTVFPFDAVAPLVTVEHARDLQRSAQDSIDEAAETLRRQLEVTTHVRRGSRAGALQELAEKLAAIAVVVGSSHRGPVGRVLAGDVAAGLLHGAPCPVLAAPRGHAARPIERIGVAFSATEEGHQATVAAFGLARSTGASVQLLAVVEPSAYTAHVVPGWTPAATLDLEPLDRHALGAAERAIADLGDGVAATAEVRRGAVVPALADASASLDLLVCGSRGYGPLHSALAGGVSRGLAHAAACPLLLVPRRAAGAAPLWGGAAAASG